MKQCGEEKTNEKAERGKRWCHTGRGDVMEGGERERKETRGEGKKF